MKTIHKGRGSDRTGNGFLVLSRIAFLHSAALLRSVSSYDCKLRSELFFEVCTRRFFLTAPVNGSDQLLHII